MAAHLVLDAGRHQMTSLSALSAATGRWPPRPGRSVTIRLADGAQVAVPRQYLELVAPDHPLLPEPDGARAGWWLEQLDPWDRTGSPVSSFVPSSFPAVRQVLHRWRAPIGEPIRWRTLAEHPGIAELNGVAGSTVWVAAR